MSKKSSALFSQFMQQIATQKLERKPDKKFNDFYAEYFLKKKMPDFEKLVKLRSHMVKLKADTGAKNLAKKYFQKWQKQVRRERELVDGLNVRDVERIKKALRQAWAYSHSRRLVVQRCLLPNGFSRCEACDAVCPKVQVDHIDAIGAFEVGTYIERLFVPSKDLQGLCVKCHGLKTKEDMRSIRGGLEYQGDFLGY